jgi:hypothetical protein
MSNYSYLSPDEMILINILNTMYNDNYRQIEQLQEGNTRIMTSIMNILSNVLHTRERNRQGTPSSRPGNTSTRRENNTPHQPTSANPNNVRRVNSSSNTLMNFLNNNVLNNTPYMVDNIEYIPLNSTSRSGSTVSNSINEILQNFLDPVDVFPTQSQIEIATRIVRFSDIVNPINSSCPISMERFNESDSVSIIRECGHIFSTQEINSWFRSNCRCPVCRYDIRNYNPSNRRQQERNNTQINSSIDMSNNVTNDMSNNVTSNIVIPVPNIRDVSGNILNNLNETDITNLLINYYTRGTNR